MRLFDGAANGITFAAIALVHYDSDILKFAGHGLNKIFVFLIVSVVNNQNGKIVFRQRRNDRLKRVSMIVNRNYKALAHLFILQERRFRWKKFCFHRNLSICTRKNFFGNYI